LEVRSIRHYKVFKIRIMIENAALIVVDMQNDFCENGSLPVKDGGMVVPVLNRYIELFKDAGLLVFATRDWHPEKTIHFAKYGGKWPVHCVQGTKGAEFHKDLKLPKDAVIITTGDRPDDDGYSGIQGKDPSGRLLSQALKDSGIGHIYVGGLATDYCVKETVLDGLRAGFKVTVLGDAIKGVDVKKGDSAGAMEEMIEKGADVITLKDIMALIKKAG
jgi:nicotinamidase/pyrazinamidase